MNKTWKINSRQWIYFFSSTSKVCPGKQAAIVEVECFVATWVCISIFLLVWRKACWHKLQLAETSTAFLVLLMSVTIPASLFLFCWAALRVFLLPGMSLFELTSWMLHVWSLVSLAPFFLGWNAPFPSINAEKWSLHDWQTWCFIACLDHTLKWVRKKPKFL